MLASKWARTTRATSTSTGRGRKANARTPTTAIAARGSRRYRMRGMVLLPRLQHGNQIQAVDAAAHQQRTRNAAQQQDDGCERIGTRVDDRGDLEQLGVVQRDDCSDKPFA